MNCSWAKEQNVMSCYQSMILSSPDNSLKVCGDEKVHLGSPGISGKYLKWRISSSQVTTRNFSNFNQKMKFSNRFEVCWMTNVWHNLTAFLVDKACLRPGWGQTFRRSYSRLSTRPVFYLQTQFHPPLSPPLTSSSPRPILPSTSTFSTSPFSFPSPFPRWQGALRAVLIRGAIPGRWWGRDNRKRRLFYYRCWNKVKLAEGSHPKNPHTGDTDSLDMCG